MEINSISQGRQSILNVNPVTDVLPQSQKNVVMEGLSNNASKGTYAQKEIKVDGQEVKNMVDGLNKLIKNADTHLEYEKHEKLNEYVIRIVDNETKEVVKEIPPKKILDMVAKMCEMIGIIVDKKA
ncbi:flagellar protein FlaG [Haloimpatiens lingqiaonensis]|uniref:flagellar protein FlaG n=1 Tax=Haloimpatiens lingqiaonensis TaxID=1380675 RepID=UPI001A9AA38A|nr:flagellar protein FlaG [Haloimpatiens lingqiaonensis]